MIICFMLEVVLADDLLGFLKFSTTPYWNTSTYGALQYYCSRSIKLNF
jgi:hypothetical protein